MADIFLLCLIYLAMFCANLELQWIFLPLLAASKISRKFLVYVMTFFTFLGFCTFQIEKYEAKNTAVYKKPPRMCHEKHTKNMLNMEVQMGIKFTIV